MWTAWRGPRGEAEPAKYWISTLPAATKLKDLIEIAKHRWIIERDYEELKQELRLGHFEGRNWRGFHHHATMCFAAYGFLVAERNRFSPSARAGRRVRAEQHNRYSIATLRIILARLLLRARRSGNLVYLFKETNILS